jgi:heme A synthase
MKRSGIMKVVNLLIAVLLVNQVLTGLLHVRLPGESFEVVHQGAGILFAGVVILHVILNWNWVKANFARRA